jgi:hypothetical protein
LASNEVYVFTFVRVYVYGEPLFWCAIGYK